ncbi:MAG: hypothetical protein AB7Q97_20040 [Gammaproteobacteria bacterium]
MINKTRIAAVALFAIALPGLAVAGPLNRDPGVNARQGQQHARIGQGIRSGQLTRDEVRGLAAQQRSIRQEERAYRADGTLTRVERRDLHQDLNQAGRSIYQEKHDADVRTPPAP